MKTGGFMGFGMLSVSSHSSCLHSSEYGSVTVVTDPDTRRMYVPSPMQANDSATTTTPSVRLRTCGIHDGSL